MTICLDPACAGHVKKLYARFCGTSGQKVPIEQTEICSFREDPSEWESHVSSGPGIPGPVLPDGSLTDLRAFLARTYPELCAGHKFWLKRSIEAPLSSFGAEISFVFQPCCEKPTEEEEKTDLSAEDKLRASVLSTRESLKDPKFSAYLEWLIPKVDGLDLAQRVSFMAMMEVFRQSNPNPDEQFVRLFEDRIKESLRHI